MSIGVGIRTPAQVIALALEDAGLDERTARAASEDAGRRLSRVMRTLGEPGAEIVVRGITEGVIEWGTVRWEKT